MDRVNRTWLFTIISPRVDIVSLLLCLKGNPRIVDNSCRRVSHLSIVIRDLVREVLLTLVLLRVDVEMVPYLLGCVSLVVILVKICSGLSRGVFVFEPIIGDVGRSHRAFVMIDNRQAKN